MRMRQLSTWVILSGAKDLTQVKLITLAKQCDPSHVGEVPHFVRDDAFWVLRHVLLKMYS
jgi:hypothetical protein